MVELLPQGRPGGRRAGIRTTAVVALALALVVTALTLAIGGLTGAPPAQAAPTAATAATVVPAVPTTTTTVVPAVATPSTTTTPVVAPAATVPATVPTTVPVVAAPAPATVDVAALVAQVEASGIDPGPTWTWSYGDTSSCGAIPGTNVGTGCTSGAAGSVTTLFAGAPGLLLVAHELANDETENYAVPNLVALVARSEGGTSWSPIDAVASCLVVHFLGVQDDAAGSWACPADLAGVVAAGIHDAGFSA